MNDLIIIDGYNFIFHYFKPKVNNKYDLEVFRDKLINMLTNYRPLEKSRVIIVFDAKNRKNLQRSNGRVNNIEIIYSSKNETADTVIEEIVKKKKDFKKIFVVTSDYLQQKVVFGGNVYRKSIREFGIELDRTLGVLKEGLRENKVKNIKFYSLGNRLNRKTKNQLMKIRDNIGNNEDGV